MNCVFCQTPLQGLGARYCVTCYKKHARECQECVDKGKIKHKFQHHSDDGLGPDGVCSRCGKSHTHKSREVCPTCKNSRVVIEEGATK